MRDARPIWMDVVNGSIYPVFDAIAGTGVNGKFTYPDMATPAPPALNTWTVDRNGILIGAGGHLHPGGLWDDLWLDRTRNGRTNSAHLFRSRARYFEPAGPVSWDVAMTVTRPDWRVRVNAGDRLRITATYDTARGSWYEAMGIMVVWMADVPDPYGGANPFKTRVDWPGLITHGHLPENDNHGGEPTDLPDPTTLPDGPAKRRIDIVNFEYERGDLSTATPNPPVVEQGNSIAYVNGDAPRNGYGVWHTVTACREPCNLSTGIAYPIANGRREFDSGQLGNFGPPTAGRLRWDTPTDLEPGTYSFFCRVHPFMRGSFRVVPAAEEAAPGTDPHDGHHGRHAHG
jgi:plastocyanin